MDRYVRVPDGHKAVFASDQLAERFREWTRLEAPAPYVGIEVRAYGLTDDPCVLEVQFRYVAADA